MHFQNEPNVQMAKRGFHRHVEDLKYVKSKLCMRQDFYHSIPTSFSIILKAAEFGLASQHKRKERLKSKISVFWDILNLYRKTHLSVIQKLL